MNSVVETNVHAFTPDLKRNICTEESLFADDLDPCIQKCDESSVKCSYFPLLSDISLLQKRWSRNNEVYYRAWADELKTFQTNLCVSACLNMPSNNSSGLLAMWFNGRMVYSEHAVVYVSGQKLTFQLRKIKCFLKMENAVT